MPLSPDSPNPPGFGAEARPQANPQPGPQLSPQIRPFGTGSLGGGGGGAPGLSAPHAVPSPAHAPDRIEKAPPQPVNKITQFEQRFSAKRHEENWKRSPNVNGTGAIHVRSFHCKLVGESLAVLDQQINEWLDAHPDYEVKLVSTSVGEWTGKIKEPALVVSVWV